MIDILVNNYEFFMAVLGFIISIIFGIIIIILQLKIKRIDNHITSKNITNENKKLMRNYDKLYKTNYKNTNYIKDNYDWYYLNFLYTLTMLYYKINENINNMKKEKSKKIDSTLFYYYSNIELLKNNIIQNFVNTKDCSRKINEFDNTVYSKVVDILYFDKYINNSDQNYLTALDLIFSLIFDNTKYRETLKNVGESFTSYKKLTEKLMIYANDLCSINYCIKYGRSVNYKYINDFGSICEKYNKHIESFIDTISSYHIEGFKFMKGTKDIDKIIEEIKIVFNEVEWDIAMNNILHRITIEIFNRIQNLIKSALKSDNNENILYLK